MTTTRNVGIYLFPDVEALDVAGPYEVFTTASRVSQRQHPGQAEPFRVFSVAAVPLTAVGLAPVRARAGLRIAPDHALDAHPPIDVLVIPGGVVTAELGRPEVLRWAAGIDMSLHLVERLCDPALAGATARQMDYPWSWE